MFSDHLFVALVLLSLLFDSLGCFEYFGNYLFFSKNPTRWFRVFLGIQWHFSALNPHLRAILVVASSDTADSLTSCRRLLSLLAYGEFQSALI